MHYRTKIALFLVVFITFFLIIRFAGEGFILKLTLNDLGGVPWLFSSIGLIFSILAGFLIQRLWENWEGLQQVVLDEIYTLDRILLSAELASAVHAQNIRDCISDYIQHIATYEWAQMSTSTIDAKAGKIIARIRVEFQNDDVPPEEKNIALALISKVSRIRQSRLRLMARRMPYIIKHAFLLCTSMVIVLSLFVGVKSILLDLLFTTSISVLVFVIYLIVDDLDDMLSPGSWHISPRQYKEFFDSEYKKI